MQRALLLDFVDFETAFDSVFRDALWTILRGYSIPEKIIKMVRCLYDGFWSYRPIVSNILGMLNVLRFFRNFACKNLEILQVVYQSSGQRGCD